MVRDVVTALESPFTREELNQIPRTAISIPILYKQPKKDEGKKVSFALSLFINTESHILKFIKASFKTRGPFNAIHQYWCVSLTWAYIKNTMKTWKETRILRADSWAAIKPVSIPASSASILPNNLASVLGHPHQLLLALRSSITNNAYFKLDGNQTRPSF